MRVSHSSVASTRSVLTSRFAAAATLMFVLVLAIGCTTSGLSPREVRGQDFSTYVLALYEPIPAGSRAGVAQAQPPQPLRVAVAQIGEVAPPQEVLEILRKDTAAFASVQPIPGVTDVSGDPAYHGSRPYHPPQMRQSAEAHIDRMRRYARDIGADYLFLYGGTIDRATTGTPLGAADLTIVGAFFVPSKRIEGVARASGALVNVESGRVVISVSADSEDTRVAPSFARETGELKLLKNLRDKVVVELAEQLATRVKAEAGLGG